MPNFLLPAKDVQEALSFFKPIVDQGLARFVDLTQRPDLWERLGPHDEVYVIVAPSGTVPPETVEITRTLEEFRPQGTPEEQFSAWQAEEAVPAPPESEDPPAPAETVADSASEAESVVTVPGPEEPSPPTANEPLPTETASDSPVTGPDPGDLLKGDWPSYTSRGYSTRR